MNKKIEDNKDIKTTKSVTEKKVEPIKAEKSSVKVSSFKKKKKVKRNITTQLFPLQTKAGMLSHGLLQVLKALKVLENQHLMLLKLQPMMLVVKRMSKA
jgi:hypothetical protein